MFKPISWNDKYWEGLPGLLVKLNVLFSGGISLHHKVRFIHLSKGNFISKGILYVYLYLFHVLKISICQLNKFLKLILLKSPKNNHHIKIKKFFHPGLEITIISCYLLKAWLLVSYTVAKVSMANPPRRGRGDLAQPCFLCHIEYQLGYSLYSHFYTVYIVQAELSFLKLCTVSANFVIFWILQPFKPHL